MASRDLLRRRMEGDSAIISHYDINQVEVGRLFLGVYGRGQRNTLVRTVKKKRDEITDADYEALANLRYILRRFSEFSTSAAHQEGLPSQQHQALLAIKGDRGDTPMTVGLLAERLLIAPHTASELVERLVLAGYVTRAPDPADKRRQTLALTTRAADVLKRLSTVHLIEIRDMAPRLIELLSDLQAEDPFPES
jgi:DNA-binding MarR family transcriptional regulator